MVKQTLEQKKAIRIVLNGDHSTSHLAITSQDRDLLTSINTFVALLEDLTETLSGETHVTNLQLNQCFSISVMFF